MLKAALQSAIDHGHSLDFWASGETYSGTPMRMDREFVVLACLDALADPPVSTCWILRIDRIDSICIAGQFWDDDRAIGVQLRDDDEPPSVATVGA